MSIFVYFRVGDFKQRVTIEQLRSRISLPYEEKVLWAMDVIVEFWGQMEGRVHVSFSGGKDSQVLLHLVRSIFPEVPGVFCDTGLEFPEIRKHVKGFENITWLKPAMKFPDVIRDVGVAIGSKKVAKMVHTLRNPTEKNVDSRRLYLMGIKRDGSKTGSFKLAKRWYPLLDAPFKVSGKCCDIFKKDPFRGYEKSMGTKPYIGTRVGEGEMRRAGYLATGCNSFGKNTMSRPLSIWTDGDVDRYISENGLRLAGVYYDRIVENNGCSVSVSGEERTGCMFCMFGPLKQVEKRIQRMYSTHPRQWDFLIHKTEIGVVCEYLGINPVPAENVGVQMNLFD